MPNVACGSPIKRCAVYTRKSTHHGLSQEYSSIDHQRTVCSAYIASQAHRGWMPVPKAYDDAAYSGATLERPALQNLLIDVERGLVDVIVLYKLDRISRSLADFVRLLEVFDRHAVAFVCITQNFDTSDSLGRLVMNVLLTFAQFEREITSDRIKDKRQALAKRGLWTGGAPPLGYDLINHRLKLNPDEAERVRWIYDRYHETRSTVRVWRECTERGIESKTRRTRNGRLVRGKLMPFASLRSILVNPVYTGVIKFSGQLYASDHEAIIPQDLWDEVQQIRAQNAFPKATEIVDLLPMLVWDSFGRRMSVNRLYKKTGCFRHYVSRSERWGEASVRKRVRAKADELEKLVISAIDDLICTPEKLRSILLDLGRHGADVEGIPRHWRRASAILRACSAPRLQKVLQALVVRIELSADRVKIVLRSSEVVRFVEWDGYAEFAGGAAVLDRPETVLLDVPACAIRLERRLRLPIKPRDEGQRLSCNPNLVRLVREAREAQALVERERTQSLAALARRTGRKEALLQKLVRLNYLAPDIITAILDGSQPKELTRRRLLNANIPMDWSLQRKLLGFPPQSAIRADEQIY